MTSEGEMESDTASLLSHSPRQDSYGTHSALTQVESSPPDLCSAGAETVSSVRWRRGVSGLLRQQWRLMVVLGTPLLLSPLPLTLHTRAANAAYSIAIIAVYWVTEALPVAVTALLPLWLFPALGVLSARATAQNYLSDTNMLFVGGLMVALAVEKWNLHKRIALIVLLAVGSKPRWLLLGFMGTTAFLSMWISNTATAAMMLAIAHAVLKELEDEASTPDHSSSVDGGGETPQSAVKIVYSKRHNGSSGELREEVSLELETGSERHRERRESEQDSLLDDDRGVSESGADGDMRSERGSMEQRTEPDPSLCRLSKVLMLGVAYSANIGGTATLTGTGPNIVLNGLSVSLFPESNGINFGLWFVFATPAMLLALLLSWLYLSLLYCDDSFQWCKRRLIRRVHTFHMSRAKKVIKDQYKKLGRIKYAEVVVLVLFVVLALLWLLREPRFIPGWASFFHRDNGTSYFSDASTAMFVVFLMFIIPSRPPWSSGCSGSVPCDTLLDWNTVQSKLAWNVVILLGSGFALSAGAKDSGLSAWIGGRLLSLRSLPSPVIALCISIIITSVTEFMSNVATTTLFLPVLAQLAVELGTNPLYFMIAATVSASYAFMLPVATPPNAMAFSYGYLKVYNMVLTGLFMNIMCVGIVTLALNTTGRLIFHLDTFPSWAGNLTTDPVCLQWSSLNHTTAITSYPAR